MSGNRCSSCYKNECEAIRLKQRIAGLEVENQRLQHENEDWRLDIIEELQRFRAENKRIRDAAQVVVRHNRMNQIHDDPATDNLEAALEGVSD